jgi:hypothetical protein
MKCVLGNNEVTEFFFNDTNGVWWDVIKRVTGAGYFHQKAVMTPRHQEGV